MEPGAVLLPTAYFPPLSYYAYLASGKRVFIEQMETYPKQTYRNRCEIATVSGKMNLIIPVSKPYGNHTRTHQVEISYREAWQMKHWRALQTAYSASPFYAYYADLLHDLFQRREKSLIQHNLNALKVANALLGINPEITLTDDYVKTYHDRSDLRRTFSPKRDQILTNAPRYPQVFEHMEGFIPGLSILDLLFNLGPDARKYLFSCNPSD